MHKKSAWYTLMHFWLFKNGIANVYDIYTIMGVCSDEIQVVNIPLWASVNWEKRIQMMPSL